MGGETEAWRSLWYLSRLDPRIVQGGGCQVTLQAPPHILQRGEESRNPQLFDALWVIPREMVTQN